MYRFLKRTFDIFSSGLALIVLLPVWLIAIIGIEVSDPGPVFYFANRAGKDNKTFKMYKFRSMRVDKNANEKSLRPDQDRIFKFGRFIRATKIDELPQLLNVFLGDMPEAVYNTSVFFKNDYEVTCDRDIDTVLGCWVINHNIKGKKEGDYIKINGSYADPAEADPGSVHLPR